MSGGGVDANLESISTTKFTSLKSKPSVHKCPALYVNDMLVAASSKQMDEEVMSSLEEEFRLKRLGATRIVVAIKIRGPLTQDDAHISATI
ncbi:hypothetical protein CCR75_009483 [Bremia lactucae]|uniref:Uncharacterized protein n=1 Tax=Bremia lactucae TaxID=4779 RepID=A0A976FPY4_BRELC|nr:hypothetical protein CCR75_009483 [Bremia lactucae]